MASISVFLSRWLLSKESRLGLPGEPRPPGHHTDGVPRWHLKVALIVFVAFLQFGSLYLGYRVYSILPDLEYVNLATPLDRAIPYLEWTWAIYYFGFAYAIFWGAAGLWRLTRKTLYWTVGVYSALVIVGAVLHLLIPTRAPWPTVEDFTAVQQSFKTSYHIEPLACFPSMHVALAVLPAYVSLYTFHSYAYRILSVVLALAVCVSILTAKEHWVMDAIGGLALGLIAGWAWRVYVYEPGEGQAQVEASEQVSHSRV